jgi:hypothetical protein
VAVVAQLLHNCRDAICGICPGRPGLDVRPLVCAIAGLVAVLVGFVRTADCFWSCTRISLVKGAGRPIADLLNAYLRRCALGQLLIIMRRRWRLRVVLETIAAGFTLPHGI